MDAARQPVDELVVLLIAAVVVVLVLLSQRSSARAARDAAEQRAAELAQSVEQRVADRLFYRSRGGLFSVPIDTSASFVASKPKRLFQSA